MTWRLLALPPLPHDLLEALFGDPRIELVTPPERTQAAVDALLPTVDLLLGDWSPQLRVPDPGPRVAFVQQPSAGVDGIDLEACAARAVPVANCAGANATSVAEWCVSATFALLRKTVEADAAVRRGEWPQTRLGGRELAGQRVGVVGMGPIGSNTARLFDALGCQVSYWSRSRHADAPVPYSELDDLLASSDVVVLVIALGAETRGLLDAVRIASMKHGALLVNGARGEVVDEAALIAALAEGRLAGAATDVFTQEPLPECSPLRQAPNLLLSPHVAGSTVEGAIRIVGQAKANLLRVLEGQPVLDVVNGVEATVASRA
ncbi:MAG: D-3-phosphoglycerate dehydrogenase [Frankiales bacterium]|nr:D-3-phosphoglycerate dehydrogenase [Frankiales bacterium]